MAKRVEGKEKEVERDIPSHFTECDGMCAKRATLDGAVVMQCRLHLCFQRRDRSKVHLCQHDKFEMRDRKLTVRKCLPRDADWTSHAISCSNSADRL
ncbi:hypothetical protein PsorP6_016812 [Peronosclerospora sorghi]|uniref:Uncharacterized protein n=1 Tax=Peronosclerospora sorghi TaxID=230839 RepID=A0ACC0WGC8_9STRA|nr:hypothetical protein PsorP6_016812 [Peronosclerospora sorghi]